MTWADYRSSLVHFWIEGTRLKIIEVLPGVGSLVFACFDEPEEAGGY